MIVLAVRKYLAETAIFEIVLEAEIIGLTDCVSSYVSIHLFLCTFWNIA